MRIYMIRHGATKGNIENRYVGSTDEPLLQESRIVLQSKKEYFQKLIGLESDNGFLKLIVSPLFRCRETADILFPGIPQHIENAFCECDFGEFEYMNYKELNGNADYQAFIDSGGMSGFPGGETRKEFSDRCINAFRKLISESVHNGICGNGLQENDVLVLVVHGGTIMALLEHFSKPHGDYYDWQVKNGEGFMAQLCLDGKKVLYMTDVQPIG